LRACVLILALVGCGRLGFDATSERVADAPADVSDVAADALAAPGLLAHFAFDDTPLDGVDNRAIGGGLATCLTTCPTVVPGVSGSAYQFNGATDAIRYADSPALHTQAGTVAMWVRIDQPPPMDQYMVFISKPFETFLENTWEMFLVQGTTLDFAGGGDSGNLDTYAGAQWTTALDTWVHVALTWDVKVRLYVGGVKIAEENNPGRSYDSGDVYIGSDFDNGAPTAFVKGAIDSVYMFSYELAPGQIATLATP